MSDSGIFIHGTVVANTDSWVFFYTFLERYSYIIPTYISVIELSYNYFGGNLYEGKQNYENKKR